jgi:peptide-methionine (R)-S-oxide reductase
MSDYKINKTDAEWKSQLSDEQYRILRKKGTEMPFTGIYNSHSETGLYYCAGCEAPLFKSEAKFDSGCGWPSFDASIKGNVNYNLDKSHGMLRTEIICESCGGHLGHVFNDGPTATGTRYCVNSASLDFKKT